MNELFGLLFRSGGQSLKKECFLDCEGGISFKLIVQVTFHMKLKEKTKQLCSKVNEAWNVLDYDFFQSNDFLKKYFYL